jgi:adenosine/AMP kinase
MKLELIKLDFPKDCQIILGQSHFIKTVEDLHEAMVNSVPGIKFGLAFCESSGPCLVRHSGTDEELEKIAAEQALKLGCGHCFLIVMRGAYPINVLNRIKEVPEVCTIYCATANPIKVLIIEDEEGNRGIAGVIDGSRSKGIENEEDIKERKEFLRKIGYKF